jgi:hypothetical protein
MCFGIFIRRQRHGEFICKSYATILIACLEKSNSSLDYIGSRVGISLQTNDTPTRGAASTLPL